MHKLTKGAHTQVPKPPVAGRVKPLNIAMFWRTLLLSLIMTVCAVAFHENTFAVFELKEQLQILYLNMWELLHQLEYVNPDQRLIVYQEIEHIKQQIADTIDLLKQHDQSQHP